MIRRALPLMAVLALTACAAKAPEPPAPPPPPPEPTTIVMDAGDLAALQGALTIMGTKPVDMAVPWTNAATGKAGSVKVLRDGFDPQNRPCREFHAVVNDQKLVQHSTGFLCRKPDGQWEVVQVRDYPVYKRAGA